MARLGELNVLLDMDKRDKVLLDEATDIKDAEPERKKEGRER